MPSADQDPADIAKAYHDLVKAENTASEMEKRLDSLDQRLDELLSTIPPELLEADSETIKHYLSLKASNAPEERQQDTEAAPSGSSSGCHKAPEPHGK